MKSRARFSCLLAFIVLALLQLSACSGTPSTFNQVTISPSGTMYLGQGGTIPLISASVLNDTKLNGGVTFTLLPVGVGSGTLTQLTSGTASFAAPGVVTAETIVTITATSVDFPKQSATLTVKIEPPPQITTTTVPDATLDTAYTAPVTATGGVPPLAWTLSSGTLPAGLALGKSTTDTVNITGKATTAGVSTFTVTVTDATGASSTSVQFQIVVSSLAFTTTSPLPAGTVDAPYVGVQFAATGGLSPYTFSVANGSTLPPGLSLTTAGDLTGTPGALGNYSFGISVTDNENPAAVITNTFTLVVNPVQELTLLSGPYAFSFSGYNASGFVAAAGTFTADGAGNITPGEADITTQQGNTLYKNITGTYTAGQDGRGTITFTSITGSPTFAFAIDTGLSGHGRLIEFDAVPIVTRGSGRLEAQSVSTCVVTGTGTNTYSGTFAFGGAGSASTLAAGGAGPVAFAGTFTATPPVSPATQGSLGSGEMDSNAPNNAQFGSGGNTVTGTYQSGADATHCTMAVSTSGLANLNYDVYPISFEEAFMIETDSNSQTSPYVTIADMKQQFGQPFFTGSMNGAMAGGVSGEVLSGSYLPYVSVIQIVPSGASFEFQLTDNEAGVVTSTQGTPQSVSYTADQFGRVDTGGFEVNGVFQPVFYLVSDDEAFVVSMLTGGPISGHLDTQTLSSFTKASINGTLVEGTSAPAVSADQNFSGYLTFDGSVTPATIVGVQDESTSAANTSAEAVAGTYVLSSTGATDGSGTVTLTAPTAFTGAFYIVSPTKMVMITTTTGDTNPVLVIVGH
jgi:putative Ig domain-containing protein